MTRGARSAHARPLKRPGIAVVVALLMPPELAAAQPRPGEPPSTAISTDLASRSRDLRWPEGFDPAAAAPLAPDELHIDATCERVWHHLIEAKAWPTWTSNVQRVKLMHTYSTSLKQGTAFRWETSGELVDSKVTEFVPSSRIGWYAYAPDAKASYQTFLLASDGEGCRVIREEVGNRAVGSSLRKTAESSKQGEHDAWLVSLKEISER